MCQDGLGAAAPDGTTKDSFQVSVHLNVSKTNHTKKRRFRPVRLRRTSSSISQQQCIEEEVVDEQSCIDKYEASGGNNENPN